MDEPEIYQHGTVWRRDMILSFLFIIEIESYRIASRFLWTFRLRRLRTRISTATRAWLTRFAIGHA